MVQRPGRTRVYLAVVVARGLGAVEVQDGAAGVIVHPACILARQWRRGVARLQAEEFRVKARAALEIRGDDVHVVECVDAHAHGALRPRRCCA